MPTQTPRQTSLGVFLFNIHQKRNKPFGNGSAPVLQNIRQVRVPWPNGLSAVIKSNSCEQQVECHIGNAEHHECRHNKADYSDKSFSFGIHLYHLCKLFNLELTGIDILFSYKGSRCGNLYFFVPLGVFKSIFKIRASELYSVTPLESYKLNSG